MRKENKNKIGCLILVFFVAIAIPLPTMAISSEENVAKEKSDSIIGSFKSLEITAVSTEKESVSEKKVTLAGDPGSAFEIPPEIKAKMSKDELYRLRAIPEYFTPNQVSIQQMLLDTNPPQSISAVVIVDEEMRTALSQIYGFEVPWSMVYSWAGNILEGGDDYLEEPFGIDFQNSYCTDWESPDNLDIYGLLDTIDNVDPTSAGYDVIILMSGQVPGNGIVGLANLLGEHFVMSCNVNLTANLFQHEASHLFGPNDHGWDYSNYCIMSYAYSWQTRGYCTACTVNICEHRYRFETITNPMHITILASEGGTTFPPPGTYITNGNPTITAIQGWLLTAWEITVDGNTWTEYPWNPIDCIYDYATIKPIF